ncbi:MAG: dihydropyrimidine dehydrogenase, partial [Tidjanibacter sp.]|nr:dihydropyrimidine dehydrogenase [Tidjanibacter sp.]MBR3853117.1 dihydropyrimidine dehydrogenase [Tidjanibacter sp.]
MANIISRTPVREQEPATRAANFEEVCYGFNLEEAQREASRCLHCRNPRCVKACPVGIQIPNFIAAIAEGDLQMAANIIAEDS